MLTRMVAAVSKDHAQIRMLVYEFARSKLRQDIFRQLEAGTLSGIEERFLELEAAIKQVEMDFASSPSSLSFTANQALPRGTAGQSKNTVVALRASTRDTVLSRDDGASLRSVRAILDTHYLSRDPALGDSAITKLERGTKSPD